MAELARHQHAYAAAAFVGALQAAFLLLFAAATARHVLAREGDCLGLAAVAAAATTAAMALASAAALVSAAHTAARPASAGAVAVYGLHTWFLTATAVPYAVVVGTVSMSALISAALPRWLAWLGVAISPALLLGGGLYGLGSELDGGAFGTIWVAAGVLSAVWVLGCSVTMLRRAAHRQSAVALAYG